MTENEERYTLLQLIEQQLKQTHRQIKNLRNQEEELLASIQALEELANSELGSEILVPIANGIFAKGTLNEKDTFIVNIGAHIAVKKTKEHTRQLLEEQFREVESVLTQLTGDFQQLSQQAHKLEQELKQ